jgi:hypothetical protein
VTSFLPFDNGIGSSKRRCHPLSGINDASQHKGYFGLALRSSCPSLSDFRFSRLGFRGAYAEAHLFLTRALLSHNEADRAQEHLELALKELPQQRELTPMFVDAAMAVAAAGHGDRVSSILNRNEFGSTMEPLIVALRIKRGDTPVVAKEVMEVAMDIANNAPASRRITPKP